MGAATSAIDNRRQIPRVVFFHVLPEPATTDARRAAPHHPIREKNLSLSIFDLDNTLIGGDSDYLWGEYLVEIGVLSGNDYRGQNERFYEDYKQGRLDIYEFLAFALKPLATHPLADLLSWREDFIASKIQPILLPRAAELIARNQAEGRRLLIITATNRFVTEPIATLLGIDELIATDPEFDGAAYTGRPEGIPCFAEGKVTRLNTWLEEQALDLQDSRFYSDSHNDLPLLEKVTEPVAVDPDDRLRETAEARDWEIISLRD